MSAEVSWQVDVSIKTGELENFRALTREMVARARDEDGVLAVRG